MCVYLKAKECILIFFDSEQNVLEIKKIKIFAKQQDEIKSFIRPVRKYIKSCTQKYSISKIYIIPDDTYSYEKYLTLSINPTDDFILSVKNKIKQSLPKTYNKKSIYYKIETERAEENIEYILSIITVDPVFQKIVEKNLSIAKHIRVQWMPYYYTLNKGNMSETMPGKDLLTIQIAKKYTDLIISSPMHIQFVKRLTFSVPLIEEELSKDHFSQNQVRAVLDIDLDFNNYNNLPRGISFKILVDNFLKDIKRTIQTYQTTFNRSISQLIINADVFRRNNLAELIEREIQIPTQYLDKTVVKDNLNIPQEQASDLSSEDMEMVQGIIKAHTRGDLFLPIRAKTPGIRHMMKRKLSLKFLIDNPWKKLLVGLVLVIIIFVAASTYCSKLYERSSKNLYSVKNKLARVKQKYLESIDTSREINEYKRLIANVDETQEALKKSSRILKLIYKKRRRGIHIKHIVYDNSQTSFEVNGESGSIEEVNTYLESIGRESAGLELNVNRIEKISTENYMFFIEIKAN